MTGKVHSFQSLGTVDGPGIRFVVFLQGCNLRCSVCHNPDSWNINEGTEYTPEQIVWKVIRYKDYFKKVGGITLSGGEPLLQSEFCLKIFRLCKEQGINTCLDTSGSILNDTVKELLDVTDRVLLDIKYASDDLYRKYVGCSIEKPLAFLEYLNSKQIPVTLRQVTVPTINDDTVSIEKLKNLISGFGCIDKVELLPFRKICQVKYDSMGIPFPFANIPEADAKITSELEKIFLD